MLAYKFQESQNMPEVNVYVFVYVSVSVHTVGFEGLHESLGIWE